jgi:hypothetical protein
VGTRAKTAATRSTVTSGNQVLASPGRAGKRRACKETQRLHQADELRGLAGLAVPDDHRGAHARERHPQLLGAPRHALVRLHLGRLVGAVLPVEAAQRSGVVHVEGARRLPSVR